MAGQEDQARLAAVRKVYQAAVCVPHSHLDGLWRDYQRFENEGPNKQFAKKVRGGAGRGAGHLDMEGRGSHVRGTWRSRWTGGVAGDCVGAAGGHCGRADWLCAACCLHVQVLDEWMPKYQAAKAVYRERRKRTQARQSTAAGVCERDLQ